MPRMFMVLVGDMTVATSKNSFPAWCVRALTKEEVEEAVEPIVVIETQQHAVQSSWEPTILSFDIPVPYLKLNPKFVSAAKEANEAKSEAKEAEKADTTAVEEEESEEEMFELTRLALPQEESARTYKAELAAQKAEKKAHQDAQ